MVRDKGGLPPIPSQVFSHLGPVPVSRTQLEHDKAIGITDFNRRTVAIDTRVGLATAWQTYWHEAAHLMLWDGGVKLPTELEERICDVIGTYMAAAVASGFLKVTAK